MVRTVLYATAVAALLAVACVPAAAYDNGLGRLPPMGWNTWCTDDACGLIDKCTEKEIRSVVDGLIDQGLDKLGYKFINMDDCWSATTRNATGHLQPNADQFPNGLRPLADYIHSKGLYFGLYTCVGTHTCKGNRPGSYGNFERDAATFKEWGMDFIKADNCHKQQPRGVYVPARPFFRTRPSNITEIDAYTQFSHALNATGRQMIFSLCEWGNDNVTQWGGKVGQMWRVQMDHLPFWNWGPTGAGSGLGCGTSEIIDYVGTLNPSQFTGPYNHMDPDFLETLFPVTMSFIDSRTEYTFWSLWSAPLLVATDIRNLSSEMAAIITNPEVIAVDQDPLCKAGDRITKTSSKTQVWRKTLADGSLVVVLYNAHDSTAQDVTVTWAQLDLNPSTTLGVRDLWARTDLGNVTTQWTAKALKPHDVQMLKMSFV